MSDEYVSRPLPAKKKINSRDQFELCYLRHQYVRRVTFNPTPEQMEPYMWIVKDLAKKTYFTYVFLFRMVGLELEDVINIGQVHLVSFLGLYDIEKNPEKLSAFVDIFERKNWKNPEKEDLLNKNKANCTMFLKQRMEDVVRVCRQKARNVKGLETDEFYAYRGPNRPPAITRELIENYEIYGFKKLDMATFKSIRKKLKGDVQNVFFFDGFWYVCIPSENKHLDILDLSGADMDPYDNIHNMDPEERLFAKETEKNVSDYESLFAQSTRTKKINTLKKFIEKNKGKYELKQELSTAKKMIDQLTSQAKSTKETRV